ncbi:MAG: response regulator [Chloroflexi bacterium]|nr:response regulator [Chloroflexota bacterium]
MPDSTTPGTLSSTWTADLDGFCRQLQRQSLLMTSAGLAVLGLLLLSGISRIAPVAWELPAGLALLAFALAGWLVGRWSFLAASLALIVATLAVAISAAIWGAFPLALTLLCVPVGLAALTIGAGAGLAVAVGCSLFLLAAPAAIAPSAVRTVALIGLWNTLGLIWLTLRPLLTATRWAWSGYERSLELLEQARDRQQRLHQTLDDLSAANTQLTRLNRLVDSLRQQAEDARRVKEEFVANVSHELRTPLNMVIGFSQMIVEAPQTYGAVPGALLADLAVVQRNSQHLADLIDDVLDLSQIDSDRMPLSQRRSDLVEIIRAATVAVRPLYESKGLYLETEFVGAEPVVYCDPTRVREVVLNILSNAGRFTERGGVRIRATIGPEEATVGITDTGPGIAPEDVKRLFEPFQQLDGSIKRRYGGSGLGLSISRKLVELHGGRMWIESEPAVGTSVFFTLPTHAPAPPEDAPARWLSPEFEYVQRQEASLAPVARLRPRFVLVESGDALRRLLTRHMGEAELVPVADLAAAAQELEQTPAEALLINTGAVAEALERVHTESVLAPGVPALVCSVPGSADIAGDQGAADYLIKPVSRQALLSVLERLAPAGASVLIADDEADAVQLYRRTLISAARGYRVLTASDGARALKVLREHHPDVLLVDLMMPEMSGFQLLANKVSDPALAAIPTVIVSARDPVGSTIVTNGLAVTRLGGLSGADLLATIRALSRLLGLRRSDAPTERATPAG